MTTTQEGTMTRTATLLREAFGTQHGRVRAAGTSMQYQSMADSTMQRWLRAGLIRRVGAGIVLADAGYDLVRRQEG